MKNGTERGDSCHQGGLLLLLLCEEKKSDARGYRSQKLYGLINRYIIKEFDGSFRTSCAENIILEISGNTMVEPRLVGVFHVSET